MFWVFFIKVEQFKEVKKTVEKSLKIWRGPKKSIMTLNTRSWDSDGKRGLQSLHTVQKNLLQSIKNIFK